MELIKRQKEEAAGRPKEEGAFWPGPSLAVEVFEESFDFENSSENHGVIEDYPSEGPVLAGSSGSSEAGRSLTGPSSRPKASGLLTVLAIFIFASIFSGCARRAPMAPPASPAMRVLGQASIKVLGEKMESPLGEKERAGGKGGPLNRPYALYGRFEGRVSEALMAVSASLGYGLAVESPAWGDLMVVIEPSGGEATIFSLIKDMNRQLKKRGAVIGVDAINRRLTLSAGGD
jgi:hypothetical protein